MNKFNMAELKPVSTPMSSAASLRPVLTELNKVHRTEVIFVNDGSRDNTQALLEKEFAEDSGVRIVAHDRNRGLGAAIRTGFSYAQGDIVVTTDFDGTYDFKSIPRLIDQLLTESVDMVTASPYHPDGTVEGVPSYRLLFSYGASMLYRLLVKWNLYCWTALFRAYRRRVIDTITFESDDFLAGTELLVKALQTGFTVSEFPTTLRVRTFGQSSIKIARVTKAHLKYQMSLLGEKLLGTSGKTTPAPALQATHSNIRAEQEMPALKPITDSLKDRSIAVIGGGIMGVTLAYRLAQQGVQVTVYERSGQLGGLASYMEYDGVRLDRFYHTILSSDMSMQTLIKETGVDDKLHFTATKQGFYDNGNIYPFNTPVDLMMYPPLNVFQRFRLGLQVLYAQIESNWRKIDVIPVKDWLLKVSGRGAYEKVWEPLLRAKFDTTAADVPATYIWSRLRRMLGTRQGVTSTEMMCYLENGYYTLVEGLKAKCDELGVTFHMNTAIEEIVIEHGQATGVKTAVGVDQYDAIISTLQSPVLTSLIPDAPVSFTNKLKQQKYLGVLCPLLITKKALLPYYVLNITDKSIPFTAVVETTNLIDPKHVKGHHLVYLPKYLAPDNEMATWSEDRIKTEWMRHFERMFPTFDTTQIEAFIVQRARYVEPIRPVGTADDIPSIKTPVNRLFMGNTEMYYPDLGNGDSATRFTEQLVEAVAKDARTWELAVVQSTPHMVPQPETETAEERQLETA